MCIGGLSFLPRPSQKNNNNILFTIVIHNLGDFFSSPFLHLRFFCFHSASVTFYPLFHPPVLFHLSCFTFSVSPLLFHLFCFTSSVSSTDLILLDNCLLLYYFIITKTRSAYNKTLHSLHPLHARSVTPLSFLQLPSTCMSHCRWSLSSSSSSSLPSLLLRKG